MNLSKDDLKILVRALIVSIEGLKADVERYKAIAKVTRWEADIEAESKLLERVMDELVPVQKAPWTLNNECLPLKDERRTDETPS